MRSEHVEISIVKIENGQKKVLIPQADGYVGTWAGEIEFELVLAGKPSNCLFIRQVRDEATGAFSKIVVIHPSSQVWSEDEVGIYEVSVRSVKMGNGAFATKYPRNSVKTLVVTEKNDSNYNLNLDVWETGVMTQGKDYFLTHQLVYSSQLFTKDGRLFAPSFETLLTWDDLNATLIRFLNYTGISVPPYVETEKVVAQITELSLQPNQGFVLWFTEANGLGAIETLLNGERVNARVHWSKVVPQNGANRRFLRARNFVSFTQLLPVSDPRSNFKWEAERVEILV